MMFRAVRLLVPVGVLAVSLYAGGCGSSSTASGADVVPDSGVAPDTGGPPDGRGAELPAEVGAPDVRPDAVPDVPADGSADGTVSDSAPGELPADTPDISSDLAPADTPPEAQPDAADAVGPETDAAGDTIPGLIDELFGELRPECRPPNLGCSTDSECPAGDRCIATRCVAPVPVTDYVFAPELLAVAAMALPSGSGPSGFDLTGDGVPDNLLARTIATYPDGTAVANDILADFIAAGALGLLVELRDVPADRCGPMTVALHHATRDLDRDGIPDDGGFQVRQDGFRADNYGPLAQLNAAAIDDRLVVSGPGVELPLALPLLDGTVLNLPLEGLRFRAELSDSALPRSWRGPRTPRSDPPDLNAALGGYVRLSRVVDEVNRQGASCGCDGVDPARPLAEFGVEGREARAACVQDIDSGPCDQSADGRFCANLPAICLSLILMTEMADVTSGVTTDALGNPIPDAVSLAFYVALEPATLAEPPLAPDFAAVADTWRTSTDCDVLQDDGSTRVGVLLNDFYDPTVTPVLVEVAQGAAGGEIVVSDTADFVSYTPAPGFWGFEEFSYAIQDAQGNRSNARVSMRVSPKVDYDPQRPLAEFCRLWCDQAALCDPDGYAAQYGAGTDACLADCSQRFGPSWDSPTACAEAWRHQELCRVALPCYRVGEFDEAMAVLDAGGDPGDIRCEEPVAERLAACGTCPRATYGPLCLECPGGQAEPCGGGGTCNDGQSGDGSCTCAEFWARDEVSGSCVQLDPCQPDPCATLEYAMPGSCYRPEEGGDWRCNCDVGSDWVPDTHTCRNHCVPNPCDPLDPHGTGVCLADSVGYQCGCEDGYYFDHMTLVCRSLADPCDPDPCVVVEHAIGPCTVVDFAAVCACEEGYAWTWLACVPTGR